MKKLAIFVCCLFLLASCKDKNSIEVVPNYDEIYLSLSKVDITSKLIGGNEQSLAQKINEEIKKLDIKETIRLNYKLYIDEDGNVDKVEVVRSPGKNFTNIVLKAFENWEFIPGKKDSKNETSQYRWYFTSGKSTNLAGINIDEFSVDVNQRPELIDIKVHYPEILKRAGIEGKVFVKAFIDENGNVVATEVLKGVGAALDEAAEKAVLEAKFKPGMQNNRPVRTQAIIPIVFKLDSANSKK